MRLFPEELGHFFHDARHARLAAHEHDVVDLVAAQAHEAAHRLLRQELRSLVGSDHVGNGRGSLLVGRAAVLAEPERGDAAGVDHARDARLRRRPEQVHAAADVDALDLGRVRHPEPIVGRDVEQGVAAGRGPAQRRRVGEVAGHDLAIDALEVAPVAGRPDEHAHRMAGRDEAALHGRADKSGRAGDQRRHRFLATRRAARCDSQRT